MTKPSTGWADEQIQKILFPKGFDQNLQISIVDEVVSSCWYNDEHIVVINKITHHKITQKNNEVLFCNEIISSFGGHLNAAKFIDYCVSSYFNCYDNAFVNGKYLSRQEVDSRLNRIRGTAIKLVSLLRNNTSLVFNAESYANDVQNVVEVINRLSPIDDDYPTKVKTQQAVQLQSFRRQLKRYLNENIKDGRRPWKLASEAANALYQTETFPDDIRNA
jgi:hypothetical protein